MAHLSREQSEHYFAEANQYFPGGVNSPVRAFKSVGGHPLFIKKAKGSHIWDVDDNRYIDFVGSWGPAILGHANDEVIQAIRDSLDYGLSFGAPSVAENELASLVRSLMPSMEMMRFCSSGTEACMSVLRLARGFTGRDKIIKFQGCYHGHADMLLVEAGSGVATLGIPGSPGVPKGAVSDTLVAPFNDLAAVESLFSQHKGEIAAVIIEPIAGNANFIRADEKFINGLRDLTRQEDALLIFDEVMTGFRVHIGGAQAVLNVTPDLTCLGKVIGGGMPIGAFGGRKDIMAHLAPSGPVYQAGTLSGNPVAVTCGFKTLELLSKIFSFTDLSERTKRLVLGFKEAADEAGVAMSVDWEGGMFGFAFLDRALMNFEDAKSANINLFSQFFNGMLEQGIYLAPSAFEAGFVSMTHSEEDIEKAIAAAKKVLVSLSA